MPIDAFSLLCYNDVTMKQETEDAMKKTQVNLYLPSSLYRQLKAVASLQAKSMSAAAEEAIRGWLAEQDIEIRNPEREPA